MKTFIFLILSSTCLGARLTPTPTATPTATPSPVNPYCCPKFEITCRVLFTKTIGAAIAGQLGAVTGYSSVDGSYTIKLDIGGSVRVKFSDSTSLQVKNR